MERAIRIIKLSLPALVAAAAVAVMLHAGQAGIPVSLALLGGALLGWAVALVLEATAVLFGASAPGPGLGRQRRRQLERDRGLVKRTLRELAFDARMQRLSDEQTETLATPLRQRAQRLADLLGAEAQAGQSGVDERIEAELTRREVDR
jgi:hypothetical protein